MKKKQLKKSNASKVTVKIWKPHNRFSIFGAPHKSKTGHVALKTYIGGLRGNGIYASIYPIEAVGLASSIQDKRHFDEDMDLKKGNPDVQVDLYSLNVSEINSAYLDYKDSNSKFDLWSSSIWGNIKITISLRYPRDQELYEKRSIFIYKSYNEWKYIIYDIEGKRSDAIFDNSEIIEHLNMICSEEKNKESLELPPQLESMIIESIMLKNENIVTKNCVTLTSYLLGKGGVEGLITVTRPEMDYTYTMAGALLGLLAVLYFLITKTPPPGIAYITAVEVAEQVPNILSGDQVIFTAASIGIGGIVGYCASAWFGGAIGGQLNDLWRSILKPEDIAALLQTASNIEKETYEYIEEQNQLNSQNGSRDNSYANDQSAALPSIIIR